MNLTAEAVLQDGKYVLHTTLGQGVFGITYQATDAESSQTVVIKTLADSLRHHPDFERFRQRLQVGARLLATCQHPNLVRVLDYFEDAGRPYLVMEYIPGQTLAELVQQGKPLPVSQAIYYIRQVGAALGLLHHVGLLHRDVRPQNVIRLPGTHKVVLTDFGISCELTPGVMQTHASLLSAGYAPIEKYVTHTKRTPATDIYALAATLYYLLSGRPPVPASVRDRIPLLDLRQFQPNFSPAVEQAILCGLEMAPEQRPQTVVAWLALLPTQARSARSGRKRVLIPPNSSNLTQAKRPVSPQPTSPKATNDSHASVPTSGKKPHRSPKAQKVFNLGFRILDLRLGRPSPAQSHAAVAKDVGKENRKKPAFAGSTSNILPLKQLALVGAIAAAFGVGFGLSLRFNHPTEPGSSLLHTEQSFPPRSNWPVSDNPEPTPVAPVP